MRGCDRRCRPHRLWKAERARCTTISQSIFQSLTSICGLRLVFVSPHFVFFFVMNGYCQAGLEAGIGRGWGLGGGSTRWASWLGYCLHFFFREENGVEVPEVRTGLFEIDTRSCGSCLAPSFKLEDAETSSPRRSPHIQA